MTHKLRLICNKIHFKIRAVVSAWFPLTTPQKQYDWDLCMKTIKLRLCANREKFACVSEGQQARS